VTRKHTQQLIKKLTDLLGKDQIKDDPDSLSIYGSDWTRMYEPNPIAIAFPKSIEQAKELVLFANEHTLPIVPSGGRTGLSGAACATHQELVVSFERMNKILSINPYDQTITCEPGVINENLQNYAAEHQLFYPISLASRGSCTIGGNIATNAGGIHVIRYGATRLWVAGLKVITGEGKFLDLNHGLKKNSTGYDLRQFFVGSEGTLGLIVEATMRVTTPPHPRNVMILGIPDFNCMLYLLELSKQQLTLTAFEAFTEKSLKYVMEHSKVQRPFEQATPYYLLIEFENPNETAMAQAMDLFEKGTNNGWIKDGVISQNDTQAKQLWALRENITVSLATYSPFKHDLSVNPSVLPEFIHTAETMLNEKLPGIEVIWFGHVGDGNVHINILKPDNISKVDFVKQCHPANEALFQLIKEFHGSISAEHGIGLLKKPYLKYSRSDEEIATMRKIKNSLDPKNIMNPGKIFD